MPDLEICPVTTRKDKREFIKFPWTLYRDDPNWIPPLRGELKGLVGFTKHPFYERNKVQTFLARRGKEVLGRIAAIINYGHIERHNDRRGFFGFFDCVDQQEVAAGLFDAARQWLAQHDLRKIRGPMNPSMNYELGLLVEGFETPPVFMMTYNRPYYQRLVETYGFKKTQDLYAFWGDREMLPRIQEKLAPITYQIIEHLNLKLRPLNPKRFGQEVAGFLDIYNLSMAGTWGFVPMTEAEMRHMAAGMQQLIVPDLVVGAEVEGRLVGAVFGLLDYNPRIKQIDGRLFPFGFLRLLRNKQAIKRVRLISTNVLPEYQRMGVGLALMHGLMPRAMAWGLQEAEFSWVLESNTLSRGSLQKGGAKITKTYRLYDFDAPAGQPAPAA